MNLRPCIISLFLFGFFFVINANNMRPLSHASILHAQAAFDCGAVTEVPQEDCEALVALHNSDTGFSSRTGVDTWLTNNSPCSWQDVVCANGRVSQLLLLNYQFN